MKDIAKTQTKTIFFLVGNFFILILIFSGVIYFSVSRYSYNDFFKRLEIRAITAAKIQFDDKRETDLQGIAELREEFLEKLPNEKNYFLRLSEDNKIIDKINDLNVPNSFFSEIIRDGSANYTKDNVFYTGIRYNRENGKQLVITSAENYYESHHIAFLKKTILAAILLVSLFSVLISLYFSKNIFRPLTKITQKVKQITLENLHMRLDFINKNDELGELMSTFNNMLDRIETSFETQNNFISNASHELKTPLTAIIGESDVALSKHRSSEEYVETLNTILTEAEKLDKKVKALLFLAQTGFDGKAQKFEKVRIDQLLWDVKENIERINTKSNIFIDLSLLPENPMKLKVKGNEQLLHLAISNIISNACKYSNNQKVHVSLGAAKDKVIIVVKDQGIGIPHDEIKYINDPFFRASNTKNYEGYGIGMPLARNIIRMHQGEILVSSVIEKSTTVQIDIPRGIKNFK